MFVHSLTEVRGLYLLANTCPFEEGCAESGGPAEFGMLAAVRRWREARPYFRGHRPMALACPRVLVPGGWGCPFATNPRGVVRALEVTPPAAPVPEPASLRVPQPRA